MSSTMGEGDPDQKSPEEDAFLGEVRLSLLFGDATDGPHQVAEAVGIAVPRPRDRAGGCGPKTDQEQPARRAEALLDGARKCHEPGLIGDALSVCEATRPLSPASPP